VGISLLKNVGIAKPDVTAATNGNTLLKPQKMHKLLLMIQTLLSN